MRGRRHSDETRAAVIAALLVGQGVGEVAKAYNIDPSVVSRWKSTIQLDQLQQLATKKEADFDSLIAEYLKETFTTLCVQAQHFRDKDWLKGQDAADLAVLHGVAADKAFHILTAL